MTDTLHVHSPNDLIHHDTNTAEPDRPCGPQVQPVERDDGTIGWLLVHHSLDGREQAEGQLASGWPRG